MLKVIYQLLSPELVILRCYIHSGTNSLSLVALRQGIVLLACVAMLVALQQEAAFTFSKAW